MALIKSVRGFNPSFGKNCYLAENCTVVGDVTIGDDCSIWFNVVIRGDVNSIRIGNQVNIQDLVMIHCTYQTAKTNIGNSVSIGHRAIVHGCTISENVLIGMGAIIMDNAIVESNVVVAAGAIVLEDTILESGYIYGGIPSKKIKKLDERNFKYLIERTASNYVKYASWFR